MRVEIPYTVFRGSWQNHRRFGDQGYRPFYSYYALKTALWRRCFEQKRLDGHYCTRDHFACRLRPPYAATLGAGIIGTAPDWWKRSSQDATCSHSRRVSMPVLSWPGAFGSSYRFAVFRVLKLRRKSANRCSILNDGGLPIVEWNRVVGLRTPSHQRVGLAAAVAHTDTPLKDPLDTVCPSHKDVLGLRLPSRHPHTEKMRSRSTIAHRVASLDSDGKCHW